MSSDWRLDIGCTNGESNALFRPSIAIQACLLLLTTNFLAFRCHVRIRLLRTWGKEDYLCILSQVLFAAYTGIVSYSINLGNGCPQSTVSLYQQATLLYWDHVTQIFYNMVLVVTKVTLLVVYMNTFMPETWSRNWWAIVLLLVANIVFFTVSTFLKIILSGIALKRPHDPESGYYLTEGPLLVASAVWNSISDLIIVALPALFISLIHASAKRKTEIIVYFCLGAMLYPTFSIVGLVYRQLHVNEPDGTYWQPRMNLFVESEMAMGIISCSLPIIQRFFRIWRGRASNIGSPGDGENRTSHRNILNVDTWQRHLAGTDAFDTRLSTVELGTGPRSRLTKSAKITPKPSWFSVSIYAEPGLPPNIPADAGILVTTEITITYEAMVEGFELGGRKEASTTRQW